MYKTVLTENNKRVGQKNRNTLAVCRINVRDNKLCYCTTPYVSRNLVNCCTTNPGQTEAMELEHYG